MPARRLAQEAGRVAVANVVMLGFLTAVTKMLPVEAIKESILASVPKNTGTLNMNAFDKGYAAGLSAAAGK